MGQDVNHVVGIHEPGAADSIEWASRQDLQFNTAKTEAALLTRWRGHRKHLWLKLTAMIKVGNGFMRFIKEATG
jgi:hypothetical protein